MEKPLQKPVPQEIYYKKNNYNNLITESLYR